jgi:hypothetical protein
MPAKESSKLRKRKEYTIKTLITDLKKIGPTPGMLYDIGNELIYYEFCRCEQYYGGSHELTEAFRELLEFMQSGFEEQLVNGEIWRAKDTHTSVLNKFVAEKPKEFLNYHLGRTPEFVYDVLKRVKASRKNEIKEYKAMKKGTKREIKSDPENPELWNKLHLILWMLGEFGEASKAFQKAKKLGWESTSSTLVSI